MDYLAILVFLRMASDVGGSPPQDPQELGGFHGHPES